MNQIYCKACQEVFDTPYILECCKERICSRCLHLNRHHHQQSESIAISSDHNNFIKQCPFCKFPMQIQSMRDLRVDSKIKIQILKSKDQPSQSKFDQFKNSFHSKIVTSTKSQNEPDSFCSNFASKQTDQNYQKKEDHNIINILSTDEGQTDMNESTSHALLTLGNKKKKNTDGKSGSFQNLKSSMQQNSLQGQSIDLRNNNNLDTKQSFTSSYGKHSSRSKNTPTHTATIPPKNNQKYVNIQNKKAKARTKCQRCNIGKARFVCHDCRVNAEQNEELQESFRAQKKNAQNLSFNKNSNNETKRNSNCYNQPKRSSKVSRDRQRTSKCFKTQSQSFNVTNVNAMYKRNQKVVSSSFVEEENNQSQVFQREQEILGQQSPISTSKKSKKSSLNLKEEIKQCDSQANNSILSTAMSIERKVNEKMTEITQLSEIGLKSQGLKKEKYQTKVKHCQNLEKLTKHCFEELHNTLNRKEIELVHNINEVKSKINTHIKEQITQKYLTHQQVADSVFQNVKQFKDAIHQQQSHFQTDERSSINPFLNNENKPEENSLLQIIGTSQDLLKRIENVKSSTQSLIRNEANLNIQKLPSDAQVQKQFKLIKESIQKVSISQNTPNQINQSILSSQYFDQKRQKSIKRQNIYSSHHHTSKNYDALNLSKQHNKSSCLNSSVRNKSNTSQLNNKGSQHHQSIDKSYSPKKDVTSVYATKFAKGQKSAHQHYLLGGDLQDDRAVVTTCNIYKSLPQQNLRSAQVEMLNHLTPQILKKKNEGMTNSEKENKEDGVNDFNNNLEQEEKQTQQEEEEIVSGFIPAAGNPRPLLLLSGNSFEQNRVNAKQKLLTLSTEIPGSNSSASSSFSLGGGGGGENIEQKNQENVHQRQSIITEHCDSEDSPSQFNKKQQVRKKRAMTTIETSKCQATNKRSVSNPRGGVGNSQSNNSKVKKATTVSSITFGARKNSGKNINEQQPPHHSLSSNNMNIISTPRQCSQLLPASAIITSTNHHHTNNYQQKALNIINSQILNQSSGNKSTGAGMKCMTPVLLSRQKQSMHSNKNSIGSMPGSTSHKKSVNTPTSINKRSTNQTIALLNNNMQSQQSYQQAINSSYHHHNHHNNGSSTPSTPLKNNIVSQRPSSAARSHSSLMNSIINTPGGGGSNSNNNNNNNNIVSKNSTSMIQTDSQQLNKQQEDVENNIFMKRVFVNTQQTSDAIHLSWLHPRNFSKKQKQFMKMKEEQKQQSKGCAKVDGTKPTSEYLTTSTHNNSTILNSFYQIGDDQSIYSKSLNYILEYGVGVKVNNKEQFRQIYKGPQHKCIITDLNPKTVYRFRVAPYMIMENKPEKEIKGQWSDIVEVMTRDNIAVETRSMAKHARLINNGKTILFERPGLVHASYGYFFGKYCWSISIQLTSNGVLLHQDCTGLMKVGVAVRQGRAYKLVGVNVNYSLGKSEFVVKLILDCDARNLKIQTASEGWEVLPLSRHFPYIPAIQNKTPLRAPNYQLKSRILFDQNFQE